MKYIEKLLSVVNEIFNSKLSVYPVGLFLGSGYIHSAIRMFLSSLYKDCPEKLVRVCVALFQVLGVFCVYNYALYLSKYKKSYSDSINNSYFIKQLNTISGICHYFFGHLEILIITSSTFLGNISNLISFYKNKDSLLSSRILSKLTSTAVILILLSCFILYYLKYQTFISVYENDSPFLYNLYKTLPLLPKISSFTAAIITIIVGIYNLVTPYEMNIVAKNTIPTTICRGAIGAGWTLYILPIIFQPLNRSNINYPIYNKNEGEANYWASMVFYMALIGKALTYGGQEGLNYTFLDSISDINWGMFVGINFVPQIIQIIFPTPEELKEENRGKKQLIKDTTYYKAVFCSFLARLKNNTNIVTTFLKVDFSYINFIANLLACLGLLPGTKTILSLSFGLFTFRPLWYRIIHMLIHQNNTNIKDLIFSIIVPIYGGLILVGILFFL